MAAGVPVSCSVWVGPAVETRVAAKVPVGITCSVAVVVVVWTGVSVLACGPPAATVDVPEGLEDRATSWSPFPWVSQRPAPSKINSARKPKVKRRRLRVRPAEL